MLFVHSDHSLACDISLTLFSPTQELTDFGGQKSKVTATSYLTNCYLKNTLRDFHQMWQKPTLGLQDELIRFWRSTVLEPCLLLWTWYLKNAVRKFHYFWHKYLHTLQDDLIRFCPPSLWCYVLWKLYLKGTMREFLQIWHTCQLWHKNWLLHFGGQRSWSLWPHTKFQVCIEGFL